MCIPLEALCCRFVTYALHIASLYLVNYEQIFTGAVPYYYLDRDIRVILAIATGSRPERPTQAVVTDNRWHFIEWCWTPVDGARPRPSSDEIVEFTGKDLAETISSAE